MNTRNNTRVTHHLRGQVVDEVMLARLLAHREPYDDRKSSRDDRLESGRCLGRRDDAERGADPAPVRALQSCERLIRRPKS
jgi:hypothetical protein